MDDVRVPDDELDFDSDLVHSWKGERFTGIGYETTVGIRSEITYVDGLQHGWARDYYPSGALEAEQEFRYSVAHGRLREYGEDGGLRLDAVNEYGIRVSTTRFDERGQVIEHTVLDEGSPAFQVLAKHRAESLWPHE
jgi:antitoxin component YwqK of YwqJK toxin-antitoxin module